MDEPIKPRSAITYLYPAYAPFDQRMLQVTGGHAIYVEQAGNPQGIPVVVFHGGPGGGCSPFMRRYFDPNRFRVILFDQRGCGHSTPHASVQTNTTWDLLRDAEAIRQELSIPAWHLFGGSWGATLALLYAQAHPHRTLSLILRGVFLMTAPELDWFYGGGAARFWPDLWDDFCAPIPPEERSDLIAAYHRRLFSGDYTTQAQYAQHWCRWENSLASIKSEGATTAMPAAQARAFARLECHYFQNLGWLDAGRDILSNMHRMRDIEGVIVQGRQDVICPPRAAYQLAKAWPGGRLRMVADAAHAMSEPEIAKALVEETDRL